MTNLVFELDSFQLNDKVCEATQVRFSGVCFVLKAVKFSDVYHNNLSIQYCSLINVEISDVDQSNGCYIFIALPPIIALKKFIDQTKDVTLRMYITFKSQQQWDKFLGCLAPYCLRKFENFSSILVEDAQGIYRSIESARLKAIIAANCAIDEHSTSKRKRSPSPKPSSSESPAKSKTPAHSKTSTVTEFGLSLRSKSKKAKVDDYSSDDIEFIGFSNTNVPVPPRPRSNSEVDQFPPEFNKKRIFIFNGQMIPDETRLDTYLMTIFEKCKKNKSKKNPICDCKLSGLPDRQNCRETFLNFRTFWEHLFQVNRFRYICKYRPACNYDKFLTHRRDFHEHCRICPHRPGRGL